MEGHAFERLEDIKGGFGQGYVGTMLLHRMGHPQVPSANLTKPRMAVLIISALTSREGWALPELGNVRPASSSRDSADLSSFSFSLKLVLEPSIRLFFPARGVALAAGNEAENEAELPNADAAATEQLPGAPDLAVILTTMQQGFTSLSGDMQGLSDKVNRMAIRSRRKCRDWSPNRTDCSMLWIHG